MAHVTGLYAEPKPKGKPKDPNAIDGLTLRQTKTGKWSLTNRRKPKYVLASELERLCASHGAPINEVWLLAKKGGSRILNKLEDAGLVGGPE